MKIGVITHWNCFENYGQILQGYAFQQFLKRRGHSPFIIKYLPGSYFSDRLSLKRALFRMKRIGSFLQSVKCLLLMTRYRARRRRLAIAPQRDFEGFRRREMTFTNLVYRSYSEIQRSSEVDADLYSVGSDVVWKTVPFNDDGRIMFLDFGVKGAKRISYSASFGTPVVSGEYQKFVSPLLARLDFVGVREQSGVNVCRSMGREDAKCVVDPVFLLTGDDYRKLFNCADGRHGVFAYLLKMKPKFPVKQVEGLAREIKEKFSVATVYGEMGIPKGILCNPTIPEWVKRIAEARLFLTNSFHGTSMALILHTSFVAFLKNGGTGMDDRILSLLSIVGLSNRIHKEGADDLEQLLNEPIDWVAVDSRLEKLRRESVGFLGKMGI